MAQNAKILQKKFDTSAACISSSNKLKCQLLQCWEKMNFEKQPNSAEKFKIDSSGKFHNKNNTGERYLIIGIERFRKRPAAKNYNTTDTLRVTRFLNSLIILHGVPENV